MLTTFTDNASTMQGIDSNSLTMRPSQKNYLQLSFEFTGLIKSRDRIAAGAKAAASSVAVKTKCLTTDCRFGQ